MVGPSDPLHRAKVPHTRSISESSKTFNSVPAAVAKTKKRSWTEVLDAARRLLTTAPRFTALGGRCNVPRKRSQRVTWDWRIKEPRVTLRALRTPKAPSERTIRTYDQKAAQQMAWQLYDEVYLMDPDVLEPPDYMGGTAPACAAQCVRLEGKKWIQDTGSGYCLIPRSGVAEARAQKNVQPLNRPIVLHTANGPAPPDGSLSIDAPVLDEGQFEAYVLKDTPHMLSRLGNAAWSMGMGFTGLHGQSIRT